MKAFIEGRSLEKSIQKIKLYKKEADLLFEEIIKNIESIHTEFDTKNRKKFQENEEELKRKGKCINTFMNENIFVLEKNIEQYYKTVEEINHEFKK